MESEGGRSCLGVLQPVTTLVSTLSLLKAQYHCQLVKNLVDPPLSRQPTSRQKSVAVPLKVERQLSMNTRERRYVQNIVRSW